MNSKRGIFVTIFLSVYSLSISSVNGQCNFIQADKFDNIWVVNRSEVICFDKQSKKLGSYSNIILGNPFYLDVLDPFRIVVFYPSAQAVAILNSAVAEISKPILLREKGISDASLVCRSSNGGFWVLDRSNWAIRHFDSGFNSTGMKIIPDITFSGSKPIFMQEHHGTIYLAFKDNGVCRFDSYGSRLGDIPVKMDTYFTFIDDAIVYQHEGKTFQYNLESYQVKAFDLSIECIPVKVQGRFMFFDGRGIAVCQI